MSKPPRPQSLQKPGYVLLGQIGAAHGIRGDVSLKTFTAEPEAIADYGLLVDASGTKSFTLKIVRNTPKGLIAHVEGVDDRTAAEQLTGTALYVARERLPPTDDAEYYHADLIGLAAKTRDGAPLGVVTAVHNFGAGDLLEIRRRADGKDSADDLLVPFTNDAVPTVDVASGFLIVEPPAFVGEEDGQAEGEEGQGR